MYLLGESLRREESERQAALQRIIHDAGAFRVRDTIPIKWAPLRYMKIFDINTPKVTQKMAGYMANRVKTWAQAKQLYEMESNGLAIFACGAGKANATDPFEMRRMRHELQQCLPPLEMTEQMREFETAPTPPPAVPIPFPQGLFPPWPPLPHSKPSGFRGQSRK